MELDIALALFNHGSQEVAADATPTAAWIYGDEEQEILWDIPAPRCEVHNGGSNGPTESRVCGKHKEAIRMLTACEHVAQRLADVFLGVLEGLQRNMKKIGQLIEVAMIRQVCGGINNLNVYSRSVVDALILLWRMQ